MTDTINEIIKKHGFILKRIGLVLEGEKIILLSSGKNPKELGTLRYIDINKITIEKGTGRNYSLWSIFKILNTSPLVESREHASQLYVMTLFLKNGTQKRKQLSDFDLISTMGAIRKLNAALEEL
jgi:hypothetical protein